MDNVLLATTSCMSVPDLIDLNLLWFVSTSPTREPASEGFGGFAYSLNCTGRARPTPMAWGPSMTRATCRTRACGSSRAKRTLL
jgi:hypothetical protein